MLYSLCKSSLSITSLWILKLCSPKIAFLKECFERLLILSAFDLRADSKRDVLLQSRTLARFTDDLEQPIPPVRSTDLLISSKLGRKAWLEPEQRRFVEVHEFMIELRTPGELLSRIILLGVRPPLIIYAPWIGLRKSFRFLFFERMWLCPFCLSS